MTNLTSKEELEQLINAGFPFAQQMLEAHGAFHPFGAILSSEGEIQMVAGPEEDENTTADGLIALLTGSFQEGASNDRYKATGLFVNVSVQKDGEIEPTDAVQAGLDHRDGSCYNVFLPYTKTSDGSFEYGEIVVTPRDGEIFPPAN